MLSFHKDLPIWQKNISLSSVPCGKFLFKKRFD
jgi:hypothetical protein